MKPRCGRVMHRYEAIWGALLDDVTCGRPEGHNGRCRSGQALRKARERDRHKWPEYRARTRQRRKLAEVAARPPGEEIRRQLTEAVRAAERKVREREMATRAVNW